MRFSKLRVTAWVLCFLMVLSAMPLGISAADSTLFQDTFLQYFLNNRVAEGLAAKQAEADAASGTYALTKAAGDTTYVLAGSDFQASNHTAGAEIVSGLLDVIKKDYPTMDGFLFAGDYDVNYTDSANGKAKLQETVQGVYGTDMHEIYVQGNHDGDNLVGSTLSASGANDAENYGVFVINEKDYMWYNNDEATIKKTAENLKTYLNAKRNAGYTKPIFVISHLPLHYCMRTLSGGDDGMHANYIFDVLNEAGNAGLNIIFMFGHNHSHGWDDYLGGAAIYLEKGDKINIAQNSTTVFKEETLAFTYMNAGYVGYYGTSYTSDVDKTLTMTVFEITDTEVTVNRYDSNGTHDLKSAGVYNVEYPDSEYYSTDDTVYTSPQTITLNTEITPAGDEVEAPDSGSTGGGTAASIEQVYELEEGVPYIIVCNRNDAVLTGNANGNDLQLSGTASVDTEHLWYYNGTNLIYNDPDSTDSYLNITSGAANVGAKNGNNTASNVFLNNDGATFSIGTANGQYLNQYGGANATIAAGYSSNGNSDNGSKWRIYKLIPAASSDVTTSGGDWVTITEPVDEIPAVPETKNYIYTLDTDGNVTDETPHLIVGSSNEYAMTGNGTVGATGVNVSDDGSTVTLAERANEWMITSDGKITNGTYWLTAMPQRNSCSIGLSTSENDAYEWNIAYNSYYKMYTISAYSSNGNRTWYLRYNSNSFSTTRNSVERVRIYGNVKENTIPGAPAVPATPGLYAKIVDITENDFTYNVPNGTSAEDALAAVKAGITAYEYSSATAPGASTEGTPIDDSKLSWELDSSYSGTTAGEYPVNIYYTPEGGEKVLLGTAKVVVPAVNITGYAVEPAIATVTKGAPQLTPTGSVIYVQLENGTYYTVPVTISMLSNADGSGIGTGDTGTFEDLTLTYNGVKITENFTLIVAAKTGNDYPEYPDEGAVKVSKTAIYTEERFRETGVAQVELSVSGVPSKKGADVIVMLDTSSSMNDNKVTVNGVQMTRLQVLQASLETMLTQLQADGGDGEPMDIRIAVADFNRYYKDTSSPYYLNSNDHLAGGAVRGQTYNTSNYVYTGSGAPNAKAFVDVHSLDIDEFSEDGDHELQYASGTNYDYAFDTVYQLGEAILTQNAVDGVERDLFVVFMSDGAPFQYNYFSADSAEANWNNWLQGTMNDSMFDKNASNDYYNEDGKHWMAEAIKGDPARTYRVIRKNNASDTDGDTWVEVNGLGAVMYSIGFCLKADKEITVDSMDAVIRSIASNENYYHRADDADTLDSAFTQIGSSIAYAANNAHFEDQLGTAFKLQMASHVERTVDNKKVELDFTPTIEVKSYDIYTKAEAEASAADNITVDMIGKRKGTSTTLEVVTFNDDGTEAYSNQINSSGTNILADGTQAGYVKGVIYAKTFLYNTNTYTVEAGGVTIAPETFYWKVGTVTTSELAISYYVYLTDTMEGERAAGSYATNNFAVLYYDNYLGNPCEIHTVSPMLAWKEANVSYAFYLVNRDGEIIVNQSTGETGTFANKIAVTRPVVYDYCDLNTETKLAVLDVAQAKVIPDGYTVYDSSAAYNIVVLSDTSDHVIGWEITQGSGLAASTYVTGFSTETAYSNTLSQHATDQGYDYTHTTVWFAVVWIPTTIPDQVVIDYGKPVDIDVLENDQFGDNGTLLGIAPIDKMPESSDSGYYLDEDADFGHSITDGLKYGTAEIKSGKVRYTPNDMHMTGYDQFAYEVKYDYYNNNVFVENQYYYGKVTVIPATTIYYEESFLTFTDSSAAKDNLGFWGDVKDNGTYSDVQEEDRPGKWNLSTIDHDNVYGYDGINKEATTYSLGTAKKVTVDADTGKPTTAPTASFTFTGTGFDIISLTDSDAGVILVTVKDENGNTKATKAVDNYYSYSYGEYTNEDGQKVTGWYVSEDDAVSAETIYQVPVIKMALGDHGTYNVTIQVAYMGTTDHDGDGTCSFVMDSVRIYDPADPDAAGNEAIKDAYIEDSEYKPVYLKIKDSILNEANLKDGKINGSVFIDGIASTDSVSLYSNPGPNNEAYLAYGQSVTFKLTASFKPAAVHVGAKLAFGDAATLNLGTSELVKLKTATDMYYDISDHITWTQSGTTWTSSTIVLSNASTDAVISLTNIKLTQPAPEATADPGVAAANFLVDDEAVNTGLTVMRMMFARPAYTPVFTPELLGTNIDKVLFSRNETLTVITSADVDSLTVNGEDVTAEQYKWILSLGGSLSAIRAFAEANGLGLNAVMNGILNGTYRVWKVTAPVGSSYDIVAYDADGIASETVSVLSDGTTARSELETLLGDLVDRSEILTAMKNLAERIFTPERIEAVINRLIDGTRQLTVTTSEDVDYIVAGGEIIDRFITETKIDLSKDGGKTVSRVFIAEADEGEDMNVTAYNEEGVASSSESAGN